MSALITSRRLRDKNRKSNEMLRQVRRQLIRMYSKEGFEHTGEPGSGVEHGGGAGGSIREAGGGMGKKGAVLEDEYFVKKKNEQLKEIRDRKKNPEDKK